MRVWSRGISGITVGIRDPPGQSWASVRGSLWGSVCGVKRSRPPRPSPRAVLPVLPAQRHWTCICFLPCHLPSRAGPGVLPGEASPDPPPAACSPPLSPPGSAAPWPAARSPAFLAAALATPGSRRRRRARCWLLVAPQPPGLLRRKGGREGTSPRPSPAPWAKAGT